MIDICEIFNPILTLMTPLSLSAIKKPIITQIAKADRFVSYLSV